MTMAAFQRLLFLALLPLAVMAAFRDPSQLKSPPNTAAATAAAATTAVPADPNDWFTFGPTNLSADATIGNTYGPSDWKSIHCNDTDTCVRLVTND